MKYIYLLAFTLLVASRTGIQCCSTTEGYVEIYGEKTGPAGATVPFLAGDGLTFTCTLHGGAGGAFPQELVWVEDDNPVRQQEKVARSSSYVRQQRLRLVGLAARDAGRTLACRTGYDNLDKNFTLTYAGEMVIEWTHDGCHYHPDSAVPLFSRPGERVYYLCSAPYTLSTTPPTWHAGGEVVDDQVATRYQDTWLAEMWATNESCGRSFTCNYGSSSRSFRLGCHGDR